MSKRDPGFRYSRYEEIPLFLDALDIVHVLGVPKPTVYCMMHAYDFPNAFHLYPPNQVQRRSSGLCPE